MRLHELNQITLTEAPLGDYHMIGNWDKTGSFRKEVDRNLVTNPRMIERVFKAFQNTQYDFQFFMVNVPGAGKQAEVGNIGGVSNLTALDWLEKNLPKVYPEISKLTFAGKGLKDDSINVIFTNNSADEHAPMTPWIMAHRVGHAMRRNPRNAGPSGGRIVDYYYQEAYNTLIRETGELLEEYYQIGDRYIAHKEDDFSKSGDYPAQYGSKVNWNRMRELVYRRFWEHIGTFRSARDRNLREPFEMMNECMAQYLIQGEIKFNPAPASFKVSFGFGKGDVNGWLNGGPEVQAEATAHVEMMARDLTYGIESLIGANVGNVYVM